ncbi:MAG TPA: amidohydrolase [Dictyoglomaceae bacterium]|nr:amidohydrolase [Dictyoglomaceae bacterium]
MERYFLKAKNIYSFDDSFHEYSWALIENGRIKDLGVYELPKETDTLIYDFSEFIAIPGFIDTHVHLSSTAINEISLDLSNFSSIKDIIKALEATRDSLPEGEWILAKEFDPDNIDEKRNITKEELDQHFSKHPVLIIRKDAHSSIINSLGESLLEFPEKSDEEILKGKIHQIAVGKVYQKIDPSLLVRGILKTLRKAAENGVSTIHALEGGYTSPPGTPQLIMGLQQYFPIDVILYYQTTSINKVKSLNLHTIGGCLLVDGSISSLTAALFEPYDIDKNSLGILYWDLDPLVNFIKTAHNEGLQIAFHAVGDRGIDLLLRAYKKVIKEFPKEDHRHRIEHFELPKKEHIKLVKDLGLTLSMQPAFLYFWGGTGNMYETYLGEDRAQNIIPLKSIFSEKIVAGGGSDSSVTPIDPILGVHSAVNHPNPQEKISIKEAIKMFTFNSAYIGFLDKEKGSIEKGKIADIVFLNEDPFKIDPQKIKASLEVKVNISKGRIVYKDVKLKT